MNTVPPHNGAPLAKTVDVAGSRSRICMPVFSAFAHQAYRAGLREGQDVLAACDAVDLIELRPRPGFRRREEWLTRLSYHHPFRRLAQVNPGLAPVRLERDYEAFILVCPYWRDAWYASAIQGWQDRCRVKICWIDELWAKEVTELDHWFPILEQFDHIFFGIDGSAEEVSRAIGRACHFIPGAVDALRFTPFPDPPERVIDAYSIGRRIEPVHRALLELADRRSLFYVHDTLQSGDSAAADYRAHRIMYANMAKRSHLFMMAPGKIDMHRQTAGQIDIGFRSFEGAAAGSVLIGQPPQTALFHSMFDWEDAAITIRPDGSDTAEKIARLLGQPDRLRQISTRNTAECLRRHDWIHRWMQIYATAGLDPTPAMRGRERDLLDLACVTRPDLA